AEIYAWCDKDKMDIVFFNIISNAVKFSPKDSDVIIRMEKSGAYLLIQVVDEGEGVAEDQLDAIFDLYYEGGNRQHKAFKGTGIGLALSKDIVSLHKGTLRAEKNQHRGMTFTIALLDGNAHFDPADLLEDETRDQEEIYSEHELEIS